MSNKLCTVRDCHLTLLREEKRLVCPSGHSFDIARNGYINLLQPQDKRSKNPGDTLAAVTGRRRLHDLGVTEPLLHAVAQMIGAAPSDILLDAGCGEGFYPGNIAQRTGCKACGVDISIPAIDAAARRYPDCEWVVANADRFLPYEDHSFSIVLSITARMNASEFRRVLRKDGRLLVAVPAPDDLIELRGRGRERVTQTVESFAQHFALIDQQNPMISTDLDKAAIHDVLHSIYRPMRSMPAEAMRVTFSLDLLLFRPMRIA